MIIKLRKLPGICRMMSLCLLLPVPLYTLADTPMVDSLRDSLIEQGWQERREADGSVTYKRGTVNPESKVAEGGASGNDRLDAALRDRGWGVSRSEDGTLILRPKVEIPPMEKEAVVEDKSVAYPEWGGFEFWRIERSDDGALLFHPLERVPDKMTSVQTGTRPEQCQGLYLAVDPASLPVDQWSEANDLASRWLHASGINGLLVGKIRKVLRVYLVSLVKDSSPYDLVHQLAIRASDGEVMLLE